MRRLVIGVGNPTRGDDAVGLEVARLVRNAEAIERTSASYELIDLWEGAEEVIVVDAARSGAPPGTVHRLDVSDRALPAGLGASTHGIGLGETVEMARALGRLPTRLVVYGIEVSTVAPGAGLSAPVRAAAQRVLAEVDHA